MKKLILVLAGTLILVGCSGTGRSRGDSGETLSREQIASDADEESANFEQVAAPQFSRPDGSGVSAGSTVAITSLTDDATIRYTTDGSLPAEGNGTTYSQPVVINGPLTIKAVAFKDGMNGSKLESASYTIVAATQLQSPLFSPLAGSQIASGASVSINLPPSPAPPCTRVHTTDGSDPTDVNNLARKISSISIPLLQNTTIKAYCVRTNYIDSPVVTAAYTVINKVITPVISCVCSLDGYCQIGQAPEFAKITDATSGATINYTSSCVLSSDSDPVAPIAPTASNLGTQYPATGISLIPNQKCHFSARAFKSGMTDSDPAVSKICNAVSIRTL